MQRLRQRPSNGQSGYDPRGAKYLGGVGTKITGITSRTFKPNLQRVRVTEGGTNKTIMACVQRIRSGMVTKLVKAKPFRLPTAPDAAKKGPSKPEVKKATRRRPRPRSRYVKAATKNPKAGK